MKYKESFISWYWSHTLLIILGGFTALQTSGLFKKQKKQICLYNNNYITKDEYITFGASQALGPQSSDTDYSSLEAPGLVLHET